MSKGILLRSVKNAKMRTSLLAVLGLMIVFRFLAHVPIPLAEPTQLKQLVSGLLQNQQTLGIFNLLSGGALANFSIMILGLGPYINASIIIQILSKAIPSLEKKQKEGGEQVRKKFNQYTRMLTLPLAIGQSIGVIALLKQQTIASNLGIDISQNASILQWAVMITALSAGSMLIMWIGEIITEKGLGNGISLIIFAGIASQLPSMLVSLWNTVRGSAEDHLVMFGKTLPVSGEGLAISAGVLAFVIFLTYWVVKLNEAQRIITVYYAKRVRGGREYGGVTTILPLKLIGAGVIPIIFSQSILSALQILSNFFIGGTNQTLSSIGVWLSGWLPNQNSAVSGGNNTYVMVYFGMVFFFTYFYTRFIFDPKEISESLQKQGGFIDGVKPGTATEKYLSSTMNKLTLTGAISIGILAITPIIAQRYVQAATLGLVGTSLRIVVSVAVETLNQIKSKALMYTYDEKSDQGSIDLGNEDLDSTTKKRSNLNIRGSIKPRLRSKQFKKQAK